MPAYQDQPFWINPSRPCARGIDGFGGADGRRLPRGQCDTFQPMIVRRLPTLCTLLAAAGWSGAAAAHHSFAAHFEMDSFTEVEGRITEVHWVNPHIMISLEDADGARWELEAGPVNLVARMGIERERFAVGDSIRVRGNSGRRDKRSLWINNVLLADGTELLVSPTAKPYWQDRTVGDASSFFVAGDLSLPEGGARSFFRVWTPLISGMPRPQGDPALTAQGQRAQADYGIGRQVVGDCEVPGMPFAMMSPYPIEIVDAGDEILIRGEAYDLVRHILKRAPASEPAPSPLGTSVARIDGDELVIETSNIHYHSYGDLGPAQSDQSHVVERFRLADDGLTLDYAITITDPVMLAEPWAWGGSFIFRDGAELRPWNCGAE